MPGCILLEDGSGLMQESGFGCISLELLESGYLANYPAWWWAPGSVHVATGIASPWQALGSTKSGTPNPFEARKSQIRIGRTV